MENELKKLNPETQAIVKAILTANRVDEKKIINDLIEEIRERRTRLFDVIYVDLSIDRSSSPLEINGAATILGAVEATDSVSALTVSFETQDADSTRRFELKRGKVLLLPYTKFYIYHSAQSGKYLKLLRAQSLPSLELGVQDYSSDSAQASLETALGNSSTFSTGQVTVDNTADQIKAANTSRKRIVIKNPTGGVAVFIGLTSGVTASNGHRLDPGDAITLNTTAAIYGITSAGSAVVTYLEE